MSAIPGIGVLKKLMPGGGNKVFASLSKLSPRNISHWAPALKKIVDHPKYIRSKHRAPKGGKKITKQKLKKLHGREKHPTRKGTTKHDKGNTHSHNRNGKKWDHFRTRQRW